MAVDTSSFAMEPLLSVQIPKPVSAVVLLFASSEAAKKYKMAQHEAIVEKGQTVSSKLFYTTQVDGIGNACGSFTQSHGEMQSCSAVSFVSFQRQSA